MVAAIATRGRQWYGACAWLAVAVLLLAFVARSQEHWAPAGSSPALDQPAPTFTLTTFGGAQLGPNDLRGHPVIVNFWASWCGGCPAEAALLERAWAEYRQRGVMVVGISMQEIFPVNGDVDHNPKAYAKRLKLTYPVGNDRDGAIARLFGVTGLPETIFVGADGQIKRRFVGALDETALRLHATALLERA